MLQNVRVSLGFRLIVVPFGQLFFRKPYTGTSRTIASLLGKHAPVAIVMSVPAKKPAVLEVSNRAVHASFCCPGRLPKPIRIADG